MKKEELKFKCVVPTRDKFNEIRKLLLNVKPTENWFQFISWNTRCGECSSQSSIFCNWPEPLVTYEQALEMIAQVEPGQKGGWVEFDVAENGDVFVDSSYYAWQAVLRMTDRYDWIFGGWLWARKDGASFWSQERYGVRGDGNLAVDADQWVKPLQPKKIRFWKAEKGGGE